MTIAKRLTAKDKVVLEKIRQCGFLAMDHDGQPALEVGFVVSPWRMQRLIALGMLESNEDTLLRGLPGQTYRLTEKANPDE